MVYMYVFIDYTLKILSSCQWFTPQRYNNSQKNKNILPKRTNPLGIPVPICLVAPYQSVWQMPA